MQVSKFQSFKDKFKGKVKNPTLTRQLVKGGATDSTHYLERRVEVEDVANLHADAVIHHQVSADHNMHIVGRRRGKHRFQFMRAGLHPPAQTRGQGSIHDQLPLEPGRQTVALCQSGRKVIVVSAIPVVNLAVMIFIVSTSVAVTMAVTMAISAPVTVIIASVIVIAVVAVTVAISLGHGDGG